MFLTKSYARLLRRAVSRKAVDVFGSAEHARLWLDEPNMWLGDKPVTLVNLGHADKVMRYLAMLEYDVYV